MLHVQKKKEARAPRQRYNESIYNKVKTDLHVQMGRLGHIPANLWMIVVSSGSAQERMLAKGCMLHTQTASSDTSTKATLLSSITCLHDKHLY